MNQSFYINEILKLKAEKNALILAHFYVDPKVQEIADFVGDSYYLSKVALNQNHSTIIFCGVKFMAESAKILNPKKTIILPDLSAGCPMADMSTEFEIQNTRSKYEDLAVVCYINSNSNIKSFSDICVTSSNAVKIVNNLKEKNIFFIPDQHLGRHVAKQIPSKNFIFSKGYCHVHTDIPVDKLLKLRKQLPDSHTVSHPECKQDILANSDYIGSTSGIIDYVANSNKEKFIVCTEKGILHTLKKENPNKQFYLVNDSQICPDMKKITLKKVYKSLLTFENSIQIDNSTYKNAKKSLELMHEKG